MNDDGPDAAQAPRKRRMLRAVWIAAYVVVLVGPLLAWHALNWRVHFSSRAGMLSALVAIPTCLAFVGALLRAQKKLGIEGDAIYRGWPQLAAAWLVGYLAVWAAVFLAFVAVAVQRGNGQTSHIYQVADVRECRGRCGGCLVVATVRGNPPLTSSICVEGLQPEPRAGDQLLVTGHYSRDGVYITGTSRAAK